MTWFQNNPDVIIKYKGEDGKIGASCYWKGNNKNIGEGIQKITKVKEGKILEMQLLFLKPYKTMCLVYYGVKDLDPESSKLVWGIRGGHKFPASVLTLFYNLEKVIGKDMEESLQNLKQNLEK